MRVFCTRRPRTVARFFAVALAATALTSTALPFQTCGGVNESFEAGSFATWVTTDLSVPFFPLFVGGAGISPGFFLFTSAPTDGSFAALHGWDGDGPGMITIAQDITLPGCADSLTFDYRAGWVKTFGALLDRTFGVVIRPSGGGPPLQTDLILTAIAGTTVLDTGPSVGTVDISAFAGTSVRISFEWFVPRAFTGPAFFQLDNIRCSGSGDASNYCVAGTHSEGGTASMGFSGSTSITNNDLVLEASGLPSTGNFGLFIFGDTKASNPFFDGTLCINPLTRLNPEVTYAGGTASRPVDNTVPPASIITVGSTFNFQFLYRDNGTPPNSTDGMSICFAP